MKEKIRDLIHTLTNEIFKVCDGDGKMILIVNANLFGSAIEEESYIQDIIASNTDPGELEVRKDFAYLDGQDFIGIEDFHFEEKRKTDAPTDMCEGV